MNLYTKESGTGQPMVLLHGNGEDSSYFVNQMSFFESKYHVIAVDTRGKDLRGSMADRRAARGHLHWNVLPKI